MQVPDPPDAALEVTCHAGYRGEERPAAVTIGGRRRRVSELVACWREPDAEVFEVLLEDGLRLELRFDGKRGRWSGREIEGP